MRRRQGLACGGNAAAKGGGTVSEGLDGGGECRGGARGPLAVLVFLSGRCDRLEARMDARLDAMDARVDAVAEGQARIEGALSELSKRVDGIEARMIPGSGP